MMAPNCRQFASVERPENEDVAVLTVQIGDDNSLRSAMNFLRVDGRESSLD
jgi:hypothetical protein